MCGSIVFRGGGREGRLRQPPLLTESFLMFLFLLALGSLPDVWQLLQKESEQQGEGGGPTLSVLEAHLDELLGTFRFNRGLADLEESGWRLVVALLVDT